MSTILVTGATGRLGRQVVEQLMNRTQPGNISVLVRDAAKAADWATKGVQVFTGDYDTPATLATAFAGVQKLYMISGNEMGKREQQHENVVNAAKAAGIQHVFYTSFQRKNLEANSPLALVSNSHLYTEQLLAASGLTYTILRHALYADIIPDFAGPQVMSTQTLYFPAGSGKTTFATSADMAEAGAILLTASAAPYSNTHVEISASEGLSWEKIASILSQISGKTIQYVSPDMDAYTSTLAQAGVPPVFVSMLAAFAQTTALNEFDIPGQLENILQRKPASVESYLRQVYAQ
ncbi:NAD(P)H dehydrogenase (quinone) [Filimonas lacunae]|uniref:NAD(P)H dehydrogenase (Quinone) n=1 Tax=Filimonas lacunae TaxID=477680 RepID=A0A173MHQ9_9BACT|nr:SDR family oxidoreductase [Filimonas lacunae]BAV07152.1 NADPH:quinone oxidoreductase [Filimonas lacunae]SIS94240.1 NAD(P)H dehydrogenase (quinone) [Filimonas lacunae]